MDKFADKKIDRKKSPFYNLNDTKVKEFCFYFKMLGSKGILTPLIPDCYVLCTLAILKNMGIRTDEKGEE